MLVEVWGWGSDMGNKYKHVIRTWEIGAECGAGTTRSSAREGLRASILGAKEGLGLSILGAIDGLEISEAWCQRWR